MRYQGRGRSPRHATTDRRESTLQQPTASHRPMTIRQPRRPSGTPGTPTPAPAQFPAGDHRLSTRRQSPPTIADDRSVAINPNPPAAAPRPPTRPPPAPASSPASNHGGGNHSRAHIHTGVRGTENRQMGNRKGENKELMDGPPAEGGRRTGTQLR